MKFNTSDPNCPICQGIGWICENHVQIPYGKEECCGGAAAPCGCNELSKKGSD